MCQINPIDMNFHLQTSLEIFDKKRHDSRYLTRPLVLVEVSHYILAQFEETFIFLKGLRIYQHFTVWQGYHHLIG
jgi:hypothetical protein